MTFHGKSGSAKTSSTLRRIAVLFTLLSLLAAAPAFAQEGEAAPGPAGEQGELPNVDLVRAPDRTPREGTPLIASKLYPMQFRTELTGFFDFSYANKYVDHLGGHGALTFHIFDWLAVEGFGGYLVGDETNIAKTVRQRGRSVGRLRSDPSACATTQLANGGTVQCEPELPDLWQTTWFAGADVQWAPIYGKLSVVSEYDLNFQLYGLLGGGVEGIRKRLNTTEYDTGPGYRLSANFGFGLRLIPWRWVALRLELRNFTGLNPPVPEMSPQGTDVCEQGYTLRVGARTDCLTDFSNVSLVQLGVSFVL